MLKLINTKEKTRPAFDMGEEVFFDVPDYGQGRGHVAGVATHSDGTNIYAVYPKNPKISEKYPYVCLVVGEGQLISAPF